MLFYSIVTRLRDPKTNEWTTVIESNHGPGFVGAGIALTSDDLLASFYRNIMRMPHVAPPLVGPFQILIRTQAFEKTGEDGATVFDVIANPTLLNPVP
jgi:hypothetical protein